MSNISVLTCSFYVHKFNGKTTNIYPLNDSFTSTNNDHYDSFVDVLANFADNHSSFLNDEINQTKFSCVKSKTIINETDKYKYIRIFIRSGQYGIYSEICGGEDNEIVYEVTPDKATIKGFYVHFIIPKDNSKVKVQKGIIFFQMIGLYGIKTVTIKYLNEYLKKNFDIGLGWGTVAKSIVIERIFKNPFLRKICLVRNHCATDAADGVYLGYRKEERSLSNVTFNNDLIKSLKKFSDKDIDVFEFEGCSYDNVKVTVKINDKDRTFNLSRLDNLSVTEDISNKVIGNDGKIMAEVLSHEINGIVMDYLSEMSLSITGGKPDAKFEVCC